MISATTIAAGAPVEFKQLSSAHLCALKEALFAALWSRGRLELKVEFVERYDSTLYKVTLREATDV